MTGWMRLTTMIVAYANAGCAAWMVSLGSYDVATFNALVAIMTQIHAHGPQS